MLPSHNFGDMLYCNWICGRWPLSLHNACVLSQDRVRDDGHKLYCTVWGVIKPTIQGSKSAGNKLKLDFTSHKMLYTAPPGVLLSLEHLLDINQSGLSSDPIQLPGCSETWERLDVCRTVSFPRREGVTRVCQGCRLGLSMFRLS